jgi:hypothetical protein
MSLYGIEASSDLRPPLGAPFGFLLAAMPGREFPATLIAMSPAAATRPGRIAMTAEELRGRFLGDAGPEFLE